MAYLSIARKWRPNTFEDLVGQEHIVQTLKNAITLGRVSQAYLFSGTRGTGKTSIARIFAKALRCPNAAGASPCNRCEECTAITQSRSIDVAEIDGASNNGVEAVRTIRENVAYSASSGTYKIYIIDEVHMLTISAFNALLKTLEEPPEHVIFIFATTEAQKIPITILSRCQKFEFRRLTQTQISTRLKQVVDAQNIHTDEDALRLIASYSEGSLRDALSLLDQVLCFQAEQSNLDAATIASALNIPSAALPSRFVSALIAADTQAALEIIDEVYLSGTDLKRFTTRILEELRLVYIAVLAEQGQISSDALGLSPSRWQEICQLAQRTTRMRLERSAQILSKASSQLGWSEVPRFLLEMAAVRIANITELDEIERMLTQPIVKPPPVTKSPQQNDMLTWSDFVEQTMKDKPLIGSLLQHAEFKMHADKVELSFAQGSFYEKQALEPETHKEIEKRLCNYFAKTLTVAILGSTSAELASLEAARAKEVEALRRKAIEHPLVNRIKEKLGAELVDINIEM